MAETVTIPQALEQALEHHRAGRLPQAEAIYRQVLAAQPDHADAMHLLAFLAYQVGRHDSAVELASRAVQINPGVPVYYNTLGNALLAAGRAPDAVASLAHAVELQPDYYEAMNNLANALAAAGRQDECIAVFHRLLTAQPELAEAHNNLGNVLKKRGRIEEAVWHFRKAVTLKPDLPEAYNNLSGALVVQGRQEEAVAALRKALELRPDYIRAHSNLLISLHYPGNVEPAEMFKEHLEWARRYAAPLSSQTRPHENDRAPERRLRVGYVSPDFMGHVVAYFVEPILANHDHRQFEVFCYADVVNPDSTTRRLAGYADQWRSIVGMSDERVAELVRQDRLDILVDLAAHTGSRLLVFARKPAAIQVTALGYPDTSGLAMMDWRITDEWSDPPGMTEQFHTEKLYRLPRCAWCYRPQAEALGVDVAMPDDSRPRPLSFGSFNTLSKVTPRVIEIWAQILGAAPESCLLLKASGLGDAGTQQRLREAFARARAGIDPARVEFREQEVLYVEHLRTYGLVDIALDTFPYNGTTTTCEALWMGVPIVHLAGSTHVSRVGGSLLGSVGLGDLSVDSADAYVQTAIDLGSDNQRRRDIRRSLRQRMQSSPLMDGADYARQIELAYRQMWLRWCPG